MPSPLQFVTWTPLTNTVSVSDQGANTIALEIESISLKQFAYV